MQAHTRSLCPRVLAAAQALQAQGEHPSLRAIARALGLDPENRRHAVSVARDSLVASGELVIATRPVRRPAKRAAEVKPAKATLRPRPVGFTARVLDVAEALMARGEFPSVQRIMWKLGGLTTTEWAVKRAREELIAGGWLTMPPMPQTGSAPRGLDVKDAKQVNANARAVKGMALVRGLRLPVVNAGPYCPCQLGLRAASRLAARMYRRSGGGVLPRAERSVSCEPGP